MLEMFESSHFLTHIQDGIIHTKVKPNAVVDIEQARENTLFVKQLSGDIKRPIVVDLTEIKSVTKAARDHFAMKGREPGVVALAMIITKPISRMVGNYFINLSSPVVPTRLFTKKEKALEWARRFCE